MKLDTKAIHWAERKKAGDYAGVTTPIYTAASYVYDSMAQLDRIFAGEEKGPSYARHDNPTRNALEELVRELESGHAAQACASGMAAIHVALTAALLDRPKRVLAASALYGATTNLLMNVMSPMGLEVSLVDICDTAAIEQALSQEKFGVVLMETISNPLVRVGPMDTIAQICKAKGVALVVDNTFATPVLARPLELGANLVAHSATKYMGGHGDVIGGVVVADEEHAAAIGRVYRATGPVMSPFDAYLVMRGIKTLPLRMERHCENACKVATWLKAHPKVERVHFAGNQDHPDAATIARLFPKGMYGSIVAFELKGAGREEIFALMENLKLVVRATSLGDVHTMALYPPMASHRELAPKQRQRLGINDNLLRLSIGIESVDDICADLDQALAKV